MSIHDSQPREDNGQYGQKTHSYPEVVLAESVDGSFLFPPSEWSSVDEYIDFWKSQPISDEALTNFVSCYAAEWDEWAGIHIREHLDMWGDSEEGRQARKKYNGRPEALRDARLAEHDRYRKMLATTRPDRIPTGFARQIARAAQMVHNKVHLRNEEDQETVMSAVVHYGQDGTPVTAGTFWDAYRLGDIMPDAFYARENALLRELRAVGR